MSNQNGTQAVDRAARLLTEVVHATDPMTFTGLSAATGLAKSTTSRLLLALERNGLVRRDDHGRFLPGGMFVSFAWRGGAEAGRVAVAPPVLERLGKGGRETHHRDAVAGLGVWARTTRLGREGVATVAGYCAEEAAGLSAVLGYRQRASRQNRKAGVA